METIFKKGDKVFDYQYGWGEVISADPYSHLSVKFGQEYILYSPDGCRYNDAHPTLSFTEYTFEGFSQEKPIDYNEYIGKWGVFWNDGDYRLIDKLVDFKDRSFETDNGGWYYNFKPLTEEQIKALEL